MISLKVLLTLCIILQLASSANSIPGCLSEITDKYGEKKCVRCFVNMGFTSEFKCEFCKKGFFVSGGVCKKMPQVKPNSAVNIQAVSKSSSSNQKEQQNNSTKVMTGATQPQSSEAKIISSYDPKSTAIKNSNNATQSNNQQNSGKSEQKQTTKKYDIPENCLSYSFTTNICDKCRENYNPNEKGICIKTQEKVNSPPTTFKKNESLNPTISSNLQKQTNINKVLENTESKPSTSSPQTSSISPNKQEKSPAPQTAETPIKTTVVIHKYPQFPFCFDYDGGMCWACIESYVLNLIQGKCIPYEKPTNPILDEINSGSNKERTPKQNCDIFSQQTGKCEQCLRNYYLSSKTNLCEQVDPSCKTYHPNTGQCLTCYSKSSLTPEKKCKKI